MRQRAVVLEPLGLLAVVSMRRMMPGLSYILMDAGPHVMLDARPLDAGLEVVADLLGVVGVELVLSPEERGDLPGLTAWMAVRTSAA